MDPKPDISRRSFLPRLGLALVAIAAACREALSPLPTPARSLWLNAAGDWQVRQHGQVVSHGLVGQPLPPEFALSGPVPQMKTCANECLKWCIERGCPTNQCYFCYANCPAGCGCGCGS